LLFCALYFLIKLNLLFTFLYWMAIDSNCVWCKSLILMIIADNNNVLTIASLWAPVVAVSSFYLFISMRKKKFGMGWLTECNRSRFFYNLLNLFLKNQNQWKFLEVKIFWLIINSILLNKDAVFGLFSVLKLYPLYHIESRTLVSCQFKNTICALIYDLQIFIFLILLFSS